MVLDPTTLDSNTPRTTDGRSYPDHLRVYEDYDGRLLPAAAQLGAPFEFDDLVRATGDRRLQAIVPRWLASAEWRNLVERTDTDLASRRGYRLTERGGRHLDALT